MSPRGAAAACAIQRSHPRGQEERSRRSQAGDLWTRSKAPACTSCGETIIGVPFHGEDGVLLHYGCYLDTDAAKAIETPVDVALCCDPAGLQERELDEVRNLTTRQLSALSQVRAQARACHDAALPGLIRRATRIGFVADDVFETLAWIRERAAIIIHFDILAFGKMLAEDSHYRNQFETNVSRGVYCHKTRRRWEHCLFGGAYDTARPFERCKYGVLNVSNDPQGVSKCSQQYGSSFLVLRGVRLRTTFSINDGAAKEIKNLGTPDFFAHVLEKYSDTELRTTLEVGTKKAVCIDSHVMTRYTEAQIHGEIRLEDHIELIMAHLSLQGSTVDAESLLLRLSKTCDGIPIVWIEAENGSVPGFPSPSIEAAKCARAMEVVERAAPASAEPTSPRKRRKMSAP